MTDGRCGRLLGRLANAVFGGPPRRRAFAEDLDVANDLAATLDLVNSAPDG